MRSKIKAPRRWKGYMDARPQKARTKAKRLLASNKEALEEARREELALRRIPVPD